uniref:Uncharacterized protein n=1 Tax=Mycena chlorophos TaxID=658473 RepID=A0ABQ0LEN0_MYCCL|nr:predicted protein [Mycena chlorophos]
MRALSLSAELPPMPTGVLQCANSGPAVSISQRTSRGQAHALEAEELVPFALLVFGRSTANTGEARHCAFSCSLRRSRTYRLRKAIDTGDRGWRSASASRPRRSYSAHAICSSSRPTNATENA